MFKTFEYINKCLKELNEANEQPDQGTTDDTQTNDNIPVDPSIDDADDQNAENTENSEADDAQDTPPDATLPADDTEDTEDNDGPQTTDDNAIVITAAEQAQKAQELINALMAPKPDVTVPQEILNPSPNDPESSARTIKYVEDYLKQSSPEQELAKAVTQISA